MKRPLVRLQSVRMLLVEREQRSSVLQGKSQLARHQPGTETLVIALDHRYAVAVLVHDAEIGRVADPELRVTSFHAGLRALEVDQFSPCVSVALRNQLRGRDLHEFRIGVKLRAVGIHQLLRLEQDMEIVG